MIEEALSQDLPFKKKGKGKKFLPRITWEIVSLIYFEMFGFLSFEPRVVLYVKDTQLETTELESSKFRKFPEGQLLDSDIKLIKVFKGAIK
jgi:hypothetical protein